MSQLRLAQSATFAVDHTNTDIRGFHALGAIFLETVEEIQGGSWIRALPADTSGHFLGRLAAFGRTCPGMGHSV